MKKVLFKQTALLFSATAIMASCAESDVEPNVPDSGKGVTITATATTHTEPQTRMGYNDTGSWMTFTWEDNGSIKESFSVFANSGIPVTFTQINDGGTNNGTFSGTITATNVSLIQAIYPKLADGTYKQSAIPLNLSTQSLATTAEALNHNKSHYMWAEATYKGNNVVDFTFEHKVSILKVEMTFPAGTGAIKEVELAGVHAAATIDVNIGRLTVNKTSGAVVLTDATGKALDGNNKLTAYIFLFPEDVTGTNNLTLIATDTANKLYQAKFDGKKIAAGKVYTKTVNLVEVGYTVGDFYMKDGTLLPGRTKLTAQQQADCIGIVYWVGDPTANDTALKADHPDCTHGLVVALKEDGTSAWQSAYATYVTTINEWTTANTTYAPIISGTGLTDPINKIMGYNNTKALEAFNAANSANKVEAIDKIIAYRTAVPTPAGNSGWFLPSMKELTLLCGLQNQDANICDNSFGKDNRDAINTQLAKIADAVQIPRDVYLSSTEYDFVNVWYVSFNLGSVDNQGKDFENRVRGVLAF